MSVVTRAVWLATIVVAVGIVAELTTRVDDWAQYDVPLTAPATTLADLLVVDSTGAHARPATQFKQFRINELGFRGNYVSQSLIAHRAIVVSGASESFGLYESSGKEWPSQLADSLNGACGAPIPVVNAAFAGMSLPTVTQDVRLRISPLKPLIGVYYPTPMQYLESESIPKASEPRVGTVPGLSRIRSRFVPRLRDGVKRSAPEALLDVARRISTARQRSSSGMVVKTVPEPDRLAAFERDLRALVGTYRAAGIAPILIVHQNRFREVESMESRRLLTAWERFYPRYSANAILAFDSLGAIATKRVAADSGIAAVDPAAALRRLEPARAFADFTHFTDLGAATVAGEVAKAVRGAACSIAK